MLDFRLWLRAHQHSKWSDQLFAARFKEHDFVKNNHITGPTQQRVTKASKLAVSRLPAERMEAAARLDGASGNGERVTPITGYKAWHGVRWAEEDDDDDADE